jgi:hypothetical protein
MWRLGAGCGVRRLCRRRGGARLSLSWSLAKRLPFGTGRPPLNECEALVAHLAFDGVGGLALAAESEGFGGGAIGLASTFICGP